MLNLETMRVNPNEAISEHELMNCMLMKISASTETAIIVYPLCTCTFRAKYAG